MARTKKLLITYDDDREVEVRATPKAQVATEQHYNLPLHEATRQEHLFYLAWQSLHCAGLEARDFDGFLHAVADVSTAPGDRADPTREAQQPASS